MVVPIMLVAILSLAVPASAFDFTWGRPPSFIDGAPLDPAVALAYEVSTGPDQQNLSVVHTEPATTDTTLTHRFSTEPPVGHIVCVRVVNGASQSALACIPNQLTEPSQFLLLRK